MSEMGFVCVACAQSTSGRCAIHGSMGLGPFAGPDWQAECGAARAEAARFRAEVEQLRAGGVQMAADHVEVCGERDRLEAEVERLEQRLVNYERAGIDPHKSFCRAPADHMWDCTTATAVVESDDLRVQLAAVQAQARRLEDESNEARRVAIEATEIERKAKAFDQVRSLWWEFIDVEEGKAALRCLGEFIGEWEHAEDQRAARARKDSEAAVVNRGQRDVGAQAQPAGVAAAPTGQAGGAQSGSAGLPAGFRREADGTITFPVGVGALKPVYALQLIAGGRELMRVMNGVTPDDLRAQGFHDIAAALERRR